MVERDPRDGGGGGKRVVSTGSLVLEHSKRSRLPKAGEDSNSLREDQTRMRCLGEKRSGGGWVGGDLGRIGGTGSLVLQYRKESGMTDAEDDLLGWSDKDEVFG